MRSTANGFSSTKLALLRVVGAAPAHARDGDLHAPRDVGPAQAARETMTRMTPGPDVGQSNWKYFARGPPLASPSIQPSPLTP
jgi:hypothetical protein